MTRHVFRALKLSSDFCRAACRTAFLQSRHSLEKECARRCGINGGRLGVGKGQMVLGKGIGLAPRARSKPGRERKRDRLPNSPVPAKDSPRQANMWPRLTAALPREPTDRHAAKRVWALAIEFPLYNAAGLDEMLDVGLPSFLEYSATYSIL